MNLLAKRKVKRKVEISSILLFLLLVYTIGFSIFEITLGFVRYGYEKKYIAQVAVALTGDVEVYSEKEGNVYHMNSFNNSALALLSTTGSLFFKDPFLGLTGRSFDVVSIDIDGERAYITYEETDDKKVRITIKSYGKKRVVTLRNVKYSSLARLVGEHTCNGDNAPVDSIP